MRHGFALALGLAAAAVSAQSLSDIPTCAQGCITTAVGDSTSCSTTDYTCICNNESAIESSATECVIDACGESVAIASVLPAVSSFCSEVATETSSTNAAVATSTTISTDTTTSAPVTSSTVILTSGSITATAIIESTSTSETLSVTSGTAFTTATSTSTVTSGSSGSGTSGSTGTATGSSSSSTSTGAAAAVRPIKALGAVALGLLAAL